MLFRLGPPLPTNPRMKDPLKRAFLGRFGEYYRSKSLTIQVLFSRKHCGPKFAADFLFYLRKLDECMSCLIGIEEFRGRHNFTQTFAKRAFTCGNSARDPNRRHCSNLTAA